MSKQNLQTNVLPFDWPEETILMYFNKKEQPNSYRLNNSRFPKRWATLFPDLNPPDFIYTSFEQPEEGFVSQAIDVRTDHPGFVQHYYHHKLHQHFKEQDELIVAPGFTNGINIWEPENETADCYGFERFFLRVQLRTLSDLPEMVIAYKGPIEVLKSSIADNISFVPTTTLEWVLAGKRLARYIDYVREGNVDFGGAYPVLNSGLRKALGMAAPPRGQPNQYTAHYQYIKDFCSQYLYTAAFRACIPVLNRFLPANSKLVQVIHQNNHHQQPGKRTRQAEKNTSWN
ncbi:hypothetical protein OCK74_03520 [Chitinophagaceae bacterium LB-8]|uniref:Uncharacterized protein n=1 Tax=Paraflavisolibacter caeni TaxID=2982496 RepID=A0A9X2XSD0_9BACT|nr:hypothetical protein [Paraflavisolibacter caeni]MCU7548164.1 hypothetical protein [Paraflavisolibacter caeni]